LGYPINNLIFTLFRGLLRTKSFQGLFIKSKGRYTKRPRSIVNKRIFKFGKIKISTVTKSIDYSFKRFESKFGTCSVKL